MSAPDLFTHDHPEAAGSTEHCAVCGRKVNPATCWWVETAYGADAIAQAYRPHLDHGTYSGAFPVGPECAKRFPAGYLFKSEVAR